jgi:hypothetical protein
VCGTRLTVLANACARRQVQELATSFRKKVIRLIALLDSETSWEDFRFLAFRLDFNGFYKTSAM